MTVTYAPSSTKSAQGTIEVGEFKYSAVDPKSSKPISKNQIRNTAMGEVILDREVSTFVREAVFTELRFVGIKVAPGSKILTGDVQDFLIDDLGYSIDWTFKVTYTVTDKVSGRPTYTSTKSVTRKTAKFGNPLGALNETIKLSIEQLLDDPEFIKALSQGSGS
ncbi:hypothetical protein [Rhodoferax sp.]|uniref:hypothetical protein n=1 Tax=Rhodoferax sp. TaxID=50421 RepID=UPI003784A429